MSFVPILYRCLVAAATLAWALACVWTLSSGRIEGWGVKVRVQLEHDGTARLYWDNGDGISEERALSRFVPGGGEQTLYFPLPPDVSLHGLRFDPSDRKGAVTVKDLELSGPLGWWSGQRSEIRSKPGLDLDAWQEDGATIQALSTGPDPQIYLRFKPKPQPFPAQARIWARAITAALTCAIGLLVMRIFGSRIRRTPGLLLLPVASIWLFSLFLLPESKPPETWFWLSVAWPALIVTLLDPAGTRALLKSAAATWAGRLFFLLISFWICRAAFLPSGVAPGRGLVLLDLSAILILALAAAICFERSDAVLSRLAAALGIGLFIAATCKALWVMFEFYAGNPLSDRLHPSHDSLWFPLYRPNSGTAVFCMLLVSWLCTNFPSWRNSANHKLQDLEAQKRPLPSRISPSALFYLGGLPILSYGLLSQSRSALLALAVACLLITVAATLPRIKVAAVVTLLITVILGLGNIGPRLEAWRTSREPGVAEHANSAPGQIDSTDSARGILRPAVARPTIWKTYLSKSAEKMLFGHGFSGAQILPVELPAETLDDDLQHLRFTKWNPHNLHLSVLYFGGAIGLALHVGTLFLVWRGLLIASRQGKQLLPLALTALLTFGCGQLTFESTLMAYSKEAVLLNHPNEFWVLFWLPLCLGIGWLTGRRDAIH